MRELVLKAFVAKGFLPPKEVAHWSVPGREEFPQPQPDEVVSFLTFHERGLGYPRTGSYAGSSMSGVWSCSTSI